MSIKYNSPFKNILFAQGIPSDRTQYDPADFIGSLFIDNSDGEIRLYYSDGNAWVSISRNADFAENANVAQFAFSATVAVSADFATVAESAETAENANFASVATEALTAQTALTSLSANNSNFLQNRTWASPGAIGTSIANSAVFTDVLVTSNLAVQDTLIYLDLANLAVQNNFVILNNAQATPLADIGLIFQRFLNASAANSNIVLAWKENTDEVILGTTANTQVGVSVNITNDWLRITNSGLVNVPNGVNTSILSANSISANGSLGNDTQVLFSNGDTVYWGDLLSTEVVANNTSNSEFFITFSNVNSGPFNTAYVSDLKLKYIPSLGLLSSNAGLFPSLTSNTLTVTAISANGSFGSPGQVLTSNGTVVFWANTAGTGTSLTLVSNNTSSAVHYFPTSINPNGTWNTGIISDNSLSFIPSLGRLQANSISTNTAIITSATVQSILANGSIGSTGQILAANGTGIYWANSSTLTSEIVIQSNNTTSTAHFFTTTPLDNGLIDELVVSEDTIRYFPANGTLLTTNVRVTSNLAISSLIANNAIGAPGQVLTSNGTSTYWDTPASGANGFTGSRGIIGPQGPTGSQGFTGSSGTNGPTGFTGSRGIQGELGFVGSRGFTGSQGVGFTGSAGTGLTGSVGFTGSRGNDGTSLRILGTVATSASLPPSGNTAGDAYVTSDTGDLWTWSGSAWINVGRFVGFTGSIGFTGSVGLTGSQGAGGFTGSQGFTGSLGFTGSIGLTGSAGFVGSRGLTGSQGFTGSIGLTGSAGFVGSQGIQGIQGIQGNIGPNGFTGSQGSTGFVGSQGFTGGTGATGFTGSSGSQGATGFTGSQGNTGGTGATGFTGSRGDSGFTGSAGGFTTGSNAQVNSLGVGTSASGTAGEIRATNNITAYFSDDRLKNRLGLIDEAIKKLTSLNGFYYEPNEVAQALGYEVKREVGVSAQEVQAILPEIVTQAPIDDRYLTVRYEKLIPLLIEAIKELEARVKKLEG